MTKPVRDLPSGVQEEKRLSRHAVNLWRWGLLIALIALWELGARLGWLDPFFFSSPTEIFRTAVTKWQTGDLWRDIAYTSASTLLGFALGMALRALRKK